MIKRLTFNDFVREFEDYGRVGKDKNFSYHGLKLLWDYIENYESSINEEIKLDVIMLCCDFNEMSFEDLKKDFKSNNMEDLLQRLEQEGILISVDRTNQVALLHAY